MINICNTLETHFEDNTNGNGFTSFSFTAYHLPERRKNFCPRGGRTYSRICKAAICFWIFFGWGYKKKAPKTGPPTQKQNFGSMLENHKIR